MFRLEAGRQPTCDADCDGDGDCDADADGVTEAEPDLDALADGVPDVAVAVGDVVGELDCDDVPDDVADGELDALDVGLPVDDAVPDVLPDGDALDDADGDAEAVSVAEPVMDGDADMVGTAAGGINIVWTAAPVSAVPVAEEVTKIVAPYALSSDSVAPAIWPPPAAADG